jgi:flagellin
MVTILSNISALSASRQLGVSKLGLNQAITRLTTGRRVNTASDDAASLTAGNSAQAAQRKAAAAVVTDQAAYFTALNSDGVNAQKTQDAYRMAEMEGGGNNSGAEYAALVASTGGANSGAALTAIAANQAINAAAMTKALSSAQTNGISSETQQGIADAYLGADMGAEMANLTKYQILMQAGTSALNNANQSASSILSLFR